MLEDFEHRLDAGEAPGLLETFAIRNDSERRYGHWMKAIPTLTMCTACHGTDISTEAGQAIDAAYPQDRARGFELGDLRGAFSVEIEFESD